MAGAPLRWRLDGAKLVLEPEGLEIVAVNYWPNRSPDPSAEPERTITPATGRSSGSSTIPDRTNPGAAASCAPRPTGCTAWPTANGAIRRIRG